MSLIYILHHCWSNISKNICIPLFIAIYVNVEYNFSTKNLYRQICKKDKGAAMTLVYKKVSWEHPLISYDKPIFLAADANTNKVLMHQKYKQKSTEKTINIPLVNILLNSLL